jgi:hypothetical protein
MCDGLNTKCPPQALVIGFQLVTIFYEVLEACGGGTKLEEAGY